MRAGVRLTAFLVLLGVAGCGATDPYLYSRNEFERDDPAFNKPRAAGAPVSVCYNAWATSDEEVARIADSGCATHGERAQFEAVKYGACPLMTPLRAQFACLPGDGPDAAAPGSERAPAKPSG